MELDLERLNFELRVLLGLSLMFLVVCLLNTIGLVLAKCLGKATEIGTRRIRVLLGVGLNMLMVEAFSIPRFEWYLLPVAMLTLLVIGQLAVLIPARRAAGVSPSLATRTV